MSDVLEMISSIVTAANTLVPVGVVVTKLVASCWLEVVVRGKEGEELRTQHQAFNACFKNVLIH